MKIPPEIADHAQEIKKLVAGGNIDKAIKRLMDFADNYYPDAINKTVKLSGRYRTLKKKSEKGTLAHNEEEVSENKIIDKIPDMVDKILKKIEEAYKERERQQQFATEADFIKSESEKLKVPNDIILKTTNLEKRYRSTDFHFHLPELTLRLGEITGLVGENATGKTTLLRILAGDLAHDKGTLQYPEFNKSKRLWWHRIKRQIAYVPQELPVWNGGLEQNLAYRAAQRGIKGADNRRETEYIIHRLGLVEHIGKSWRQLSGGYKLRFALAGALVCRPQLLIIDEPLANLDVNTQLIVLEDLRNLARSLRHPLSIIISSQHIHEIEAVADQMFFMRGGKTEYLGYLRDYRSTRDHNIYEVQCANPDQLPAALATLQGIRLQQNSMAQIITTPTTVTAQDLLQALHRQHIVIHYFRDISQSVKTEFYEKTT